MHAYSSGRRPNGGFFELTKDNLSPSVVIAVDGIPDAMKKVAAARCTIRGGQRFGEPDDIPGVGLCASQGEPRQATRG